MPIEAEYLPVFEINVDRGPDAGKKFVTRCFDCVSSRLFTWQHPEGFGEADYRPLDVIDLEDKESDRKKKTQQRLARIYCLHLKQFVPQPLFLVDCRFFMTPTDYAYKKKKRAERENEE